VFSSAIRPPTERDVDVDAELDAMDFAVEVDL
jgi:hypothetical protein